MKLYRKDYYVRMPVLKKTSLLLVASTPLLSLSHASAEEKVDEYLKPLSVEQKTEDTTLDKLYKELQVLKDEKLVLYQKRKNTPQQAKVQQLNITSEIKANTANSQKVEDGISAEHQRIKDEEERVAQEKARQEEEKRQEEDKAEEKRQTEERKRQEEAQRVVTNVQYANQEVTTQAYQVQTYQPPVNYSNTPNTYPMGQCTWGAKALAPWAGNYWGNGGDWAYSAAAAGFRTGYTPQVGAIISWNDGGYGHVAVVTDVSPDGLIQVMESNFNGNMYIANFRGWFNPIGIQGQVTYIYPN